MICVRSYTCRFAKSITYKGIAKRYEAQDSLARSHINRSDNVIPVSPKFRSGSLIADFDGKEQQSLDGSSVDLSTVTPYFPESFNLAAYVNNSVLLQNLVHLNVNLSKIEKKPYVVQKILKLNFEKDIINRIQFLKDYVDMEVIGDFLTRNPLILCEKLEDLEVRINYLQSKSFQLYQISRIITHNPFWLMFSTIRIDGRLGFYQNQFNLSGKDVRLLATKCPKIITYNLHHIKTNSFVIKEEMGFDDAEIKQLILMKPKLWMINQRHLFETFNYIHNTINIDHKTILNYPGVLLSRLHRIKQRHLFLKKLGRAQYDPSKTNYVPIIALVEGTDVDFCREYGKCNISDFNMFLKTL